MSRRRNHMDCTTTECLMGDPSPCALFDPPIKAKPKELTPEVKQALARAGAKMRAELIENLTEHGLTPEQISTFLAEIDKAGEDLRRATSSGEETK